MSHKGKRFFLIRHLATECNRNGVMMGREIDAPIVKDQQVEHFRNKLLYLKSMIDNLRDQNIAIFSSPLMRCKQTARLIAETLSYQKGIQIAEDLNETNMGKVTGYSRSELRAVFGDKFVDDWMYHPESFAFPNGESYKEVSERIMGFLGILAKREENCLFLCTHVDLIKIAVLRSINSDFNNRRLINIPTGSISLLAFLDNEEMRLEGINIVPF